MWNVGMIGIRKGKSPSGGIPFSYYDKNEELLVF